MYAITRIHGGPPQGLALVQILETAPLDQPQAKGRIGAGLVHKAVVAGLMGLSTASQYGTAGLVSIRLFLTLLTPSPSSDRLTQGQKFERITLPALHCLAKVT